MTNWNIRVSNSVKSTSRYIFHVKKGLAMLLTHKLEVIYSECVMVSNKTFLSKHTFQSSLRKLIYIQKCPEPFRVFISRILKLFRRNSHLRKIYRTSDFHIQWFLVVLPIYNGISHANKPNFNDSQLLFLDASLTGMGAVGVTGSMPPLYIIAVTSNSQLCISKC